MFARLGSIGARIIMFFPSLSVLSLMCVWAVHVQAAEITGASYEGPTTAYPHAVLGDNEEWSSLLVDVERKAGKKDGLFHGSIRTTFRINAAKDSVFEDLEPRLWDVTGDGSPEVVSVESHAQLGARLVIFGLREGKPDYIATSAHIGQRFRWLAPIGAADLDGDGAIEVAIIDRPHLAKELIVFRYSAGTFEVAATLSGLTNHRIGEAEIPGGIRDCGNGPEIITASGNWSDVMATTFAAGALNSRVIAPYRSHKDIAAALRCE